MFRRTREGTRAQRVIEEAEAGIAPLYAAAERDTAAIARAAAVRRANWGPPQLASFMAAVASAQAASSAEGSDPAHVDEAAFRAGIQRRAQLVRQYLVDLRAIAVEYELAPEWGDLA